MRKNETKTKFYKEINVTSWNQMGISQFIQDEKFANIKKFNRGVLLARHLQQEQLTKEQEKYIAQTNPNNFKNLDPDFYQKAFNMIDKQTINNVRVKRCF